MNEVGVRRSGELAGDDLVAALGEGDGERLAGCLADRDVDADLAEARIGYPPLRDRLDGRVQSGARAKVNDVLRGRAGRRDDGRGGCDGRGGWVLSTNGVHGAAKATSVEPGRQSDDHDREHEERRTRPSPPNPLGAGPGLRAVAAF